MINRSRITQEDICSLQPGEIFVFGSNVYGMHVSGAARTAYEKFGAKWGQGVGFSGQSYAIPTMNENLNSIQRYIGDFIVFAKAHHHLTFLVTPIGCGIAGYTVEQIAPLFKDAINLANIYLPERFWEQLEGIYGTLPNQEDGNIVRIVTIGSATQCDVVIHSRYGYMMKNVNPIHCQIIELDNSKFKLVVFGDVFVNHCQYKEFLTDILLDLDDCVYVGTFSNPMYWQQWFHNYGLDCSSCKYSKYRSHNDEFCSLCKGKGYNPPPHMRAYCLDFATEDKAGLWGPCYQCGSNADGFCEADYCFAKDSCIVIEPINKSWKEQIAMYEDRIRQYEKIYR